MGSESEGLSDLSESSGSWARRRTASATRTARFWFFDAPLSIVVGTAALLILLKWGPQNVWILAGVPPAVGSAWLLGGVLFIFVWHLFWAPYRQRDELRLQVIAQSATDSLAAICAELSNDARTRLVGWEKAIISGQVYPSSFDPDVFNELHAAGLIEIRLLGSAQKVALTRLGSQVIQVIKKSGAESAE